MGSTYYVLALLASDPTKKGRYGDVGDGWHLVRERIIWADTFYIATAYVGDVYFGLYTMACKDRSVLWQ
jgi:hypothetical protein